MNDPNPILVQAANSILHSVDPQYLPSVLASISKHSRSYYRMLQKYCPEWFKPATPTYLPHQEGYANDSDSQARWEANWNAVNGYLNQGPQGLLPALQLVQQMRAQEANPDRRQLLLQYLMSTLLPAVSSYFLPQLGPNQQFQFTPRILTNAKSVLEVIHFIQQVCPREAEYLLHLSDMIPQLVRAVGQTVTSPEVVAAVKKQAEQCVSVPASYVPPQQLTPQQKVLLQMQENVKTTSANAPASVMSVFPELSTVLPPTCSVEKPQEGQTRSVADANPTEATGCFPQLERVNSIVVNDSSSQMEMMGMKKEVRQRGVGGSV